MRFHVSFLAVLFLLCLIRMKSFTNNGKKKKSLSSFLAVAQGNGLTWLDPKKYSKRAHHHHPDLSQGMELVTKRKK